MAERIPVDQLAQIDPSTVDAKTFAQAVKYASNTQLNAVFAEPELRSRVLAEVFRRMAEHFRPERAGDTRAVVHWRLTDGAGPDGYDRYETVIEYGTCVVNAERTRDARVTLTLGAPDFVKLITGNASGPGLFITGKMRVRGDLAFAAGLIQLFDLPQA